MRKDMINKTALRQSAILFAAALIWGFTFVAQSVCNISLAGVAIKL